MKHPIGTIQLQHPCNNFILKLRAKCCFPQFKLVAVGKLGRYFRFRTVNTMASFEFELFFLEKFSLAFFYFEVKESV